MNLNPLSSEPRRRLLSNRVCNSPGCLPLRAMYLRAAETKASRWTLVEKDFLEAMWQFDENFRTGAADQGDNQNGKGDFFTDVIALLLENASGKDLFGRGFIPGLFFKNHALDAYYSSSGTVQILIETKAAGAPKTGRNPSQRNLRGRPGSADLDKRIKEAGLKTIDLKAEWARQQGMGGGPAGDLVTWLGKSKPDCYLFMAIRVVDEGDLRRTIQFANTARDIMDGVGLVAYGVNPAENGYAAAQEVPVHLELDRVLSRVSDHLRSLP